MPNMMENWQFKKEINLSNLLAIIAVAGGIFVAYQDITTNVAIMRERIINNEKVVDVLKLDVSEVLKDLKYEIRELRKDIQANKGALNGR